MSYISPPTSHASYSSALIQTVASTTVAYPVVIESVDEQSGGVKHRTATVTMTSANPGVVTWTAHGQAAGDVVVFTTTGALPTNIVAGTAYYLVATVAANTFSVAATLGGTAIDTSAGVQSGVHTGTIVNSFVVSEPGTYQVNISALVDTTSAAASTMDIWFTKNGANIAKSNTVVAVDSVSIQAVVCVPFLVQLVAGDFVGLMYRGSSTNMRLLAVAAAASPTRPACPSIIMTVAHLSIN